MMEEKKNLKLHVHAFELLRELEERYPVDSIKLSDGTRLWNLMRIMIFYYFQRYDNVSFNGLEQQDLKKISLPHFILESLTMKYPNNIEFWGFSGTESRKLWRGTSYDIYMDPLYDALGENFCVFEWPNEQGYRRRYEGKIYSKYYVPMSIPIKSSAFWNILLYRFFKRKPSVINNDALKNIIKEISTKHAVDEEKLQKYIIESIVIFFNMKNLLRKILEKKRPQVVFIRCGYGRFPMALSQACKELNIPSVEIQHGFLNKYIPGYVKAIKSDNRDCVPEYMLTYGKIYSEIIKKGNIFDPEKVFTMGFPYLEKVKDDKPQFTKDMKIFLSKYQRTILITSDYLSHISPAVETFTVQLSNLLKQYTTPIGIIFKPHPADKKDYSNLKKIDNIYVTDKYINTYELFKIANVHSTVFSTSSIEALAFRIPNIIIDIGGGYTENIQEIIDQNSSFIVKTADHYLQILDIIFSDYDKFSKNAAKKSIQYYQPDAMTNFREFMKIIQKDRKNLSGSENKRYVK